MNLNSLDLNSLDDGS